MSQPAERRDLYAVDPFDEWNRRAQEHNDAVRERSLIRRAREFALERRRDAEQRTQDYVLSRQWALERMEADHALRIASGALDVYTDPYTGPLDDGGYPTMTEQEWTDRHGFHPPATPPPTPTSSPVDDEVERVEEPATGEVPVQQPEVPARKRGEHVEAWAARVLTANPTIGWKRLSTLVGGRDVLPESPARRVVDAHRAAR